MGNALKKCKVVLKDAEYCIHNASITLPLPLVTNDHNL